jgi:galactokinase
VPGRLCLFGEHSDWAGGHRRDNPALEPGHTIICGTNQGLHARVQRHPSALVVCATTPEGARQGPHTLSLAPAALLGEARQGGFWSYAAGVAYQIRERYPVQGLKLHNYLTDLPIKKGLSSSAAICVLIARAYNRLYDLNLSVQDEMELAYLGETTTPSQCGRMDQGCAYGKRAVLMTFDGERVLVRTLPVRRKLHLVIVDLQAQKDTQRILQRLNQCYPTATDTLAQGVQKMLGPINRRLVQRAAQALAAGDARGLGSLMLEAQAAFDRYVAPACPEELTAPVLHHVLNYAPLHPHVWGGKGVGSQDDGSAQFVARSAGDQRAAMQLLERNLGMRCLGLTLPAASGG